MKKFNKLLSILLTAVILLGIVTIAPINVSAASADEEAADSNIGSDPSMPTDENTQTISLGETKTGSFSENESIKFFEFSPSDDVYVKFNGTNCISSTNKFYYLDGDSYQTENGTVINSDDNGFEIIYKLTGSKTYFLPCESKGAEYSGSFTVTLTEVPLVGINKGETKTVSVNTPGAAVLLSYTAPDHDNIRFTSSGSCDPRAYIMPEIGGDVMNDDDNSGENNNFSAAEHVEKDKRYYCLCELSDNETGSFDVSLKYDAESEITLNVPKNIFIPKCDKKYYFTYTAPKDMRVKIDTDDWRTYFYLYDGEMNYINHNEGGGDYPMIRDMKAGERYFIGCELFEGQSLTCNLLVNEIVTQSLDDFTFTLEYDSCYFDTKEHCPKVTLSNGEVTLDYVNDYRKYYTNNRDVGTATCTVVGENNYSGTLTKTFDITYQPLELDTDYSNNISRFYGPMVYVYTPETDMNVRFFSTGTIDTVGSIVDGDEKNTDNDSGEGKNFMVAQHLEAGKTYKFECNHTESAVYGNFTVRLERIDNEPVDISTCDITLNADEFKFTGEPIYPEITVKNGETPLYKNADYKLTYKNNTYPGTASVTIEGIGENTGSVTKTFTINVDDIAYGEKKTIDYPDNCARFFRYLPESDMTLQFEFKTGGHSIADVTLYDGEMNQLEHHRGYEIRLFYQVEAGKTYYLRCDCTGSYEQQSAKISQVSIEPITLGEAAKVNIETEGEVKYLTFTPEHDMKAQIYSTGSLYSSCYVYGSKTEWATTVYDTLSGEGSNFRIITDLKAGCEYVLVCGASRTGSYDVIIEEIPYQKDISECEISLEKTELAYEDYRSIPKVTVKDGEKELKQDWDFEVHYADPPLVNNYGLGNHKISITGLGNYKGTAERSFNVYCNTIALNETKTIYFRSHTGYRQHKYFAFTPDEDMTVMYYVTGNDRNYVTLDIADSTILSNLFVHEEKLYDFCVYYDLEAGKTYYFHTEVSALSDKGSYKIGIKKAAGTSLNDCEASLAADTCMVGEDPPQLTVSYDGEILVEGLDYTVDYLNCKENDDTFSSYNKYLKGDAKAVVKGIGAYYGSIEIPFTVAYDTVTLDTAKTVNIDSEGKERIVAFTPESDMSVRFYSTGNKDTYCTLYSADMQRLAYNDDGGEGTNFKINYQLKKGVTYLFACRLHSVTDTGSFGVMLKENYDPVSLSKCTAELEKTSYFYDGLAKTPGVTVKYGEKILRPDIDYTVEYSNNVTEGTATVTLTGKDRYTGSISKKFNIAIESISLDSVKTANINTAGTMKYYRFTPTNNLSIHFYSLGDKDTVGYLFDENLDQIVSDDAGGEGDNFLVYSRLTAGTSYILGCKYKDVAATGSFNVKLEEYIEPKEISECSISLDNEKFFFDNTEKTPVVTITDGDKTLTEGTDYTLAYANNKTVGEGSVTVTGIGSYKGKTTKQFAICYDEIAIDSGKDVTVGEAGKTQYYRFVPERDMFVRFYSTGSFDTFGTLYDGSLNPLIENDDDGDERNFLLTYELKGGTPYLFGCKFLNNSTRGGFHIRLEQFIPTKPIEDCSVSLSYSSVFFDGTAKTPDVTVKDGDEVLVEDVDFTVTYRNNIYVGDATVTVTGIRRYEGSVSKSFAIGYDTIEQDENKIISITNPGEVKYFSFTPENDMAIRFVSTGDLDPYGTIYDSDLKQLAYNDDDTNSNFKVVCSVKADSTYILSCRLYGENTGEFTVRVEENVKPISECEIALEQNTYTFDNTKKAPKVTVTDGEKTLEENIDYTVSYDDNTAVGTASVTVEGLGYYVGSVSRNFEIVYDTISLDSEKTVFINSSGAMRYYSFTPEEDMELLFYSVDEGATKAILYDTDLQQLASDTTEGGFKMIESVTSGQQYILACGYQNSEETGSFRVYLEKYKPAVELSTCEITLSENSFSFDNTPKTPAVTIKDGGTVLAENTDYTVSYTDNTFVGTASVTLIGTGNYTGSVVKNYTITCEEISLSTEKSVSITKADEIKYYRFVPENSGTVQIYSMGRVDVSGAFYTDSMYELTYCDDDGADRNFRMISHVNAGRTYILKCWTWQNNEIGDFSVKIEPYTIPKPLQNCTITLDQTVFTYDGKEKKPAVTVKDGETVLGAEKYSVEYLDNVEAGTATAIVTGKSGYTGTVRLNFTISTQTYNLTCDNLSFSFGNNYSEFGYPSDYTIPYARYSFIYGNNARARSIYNKSNSSWGGNCYGMSSVTTMFNTDSSTLKTNQFGGKTTVAALNYTDSDTTLNLTVKDIIESMQISQFSGSVPAERSENMVYDSSNITKLNAIRDAAKNVKYSGKPVIICLYGQIEGQNTGHAIVAYDVQHISSTQENILVYDPNFKNVSKTVELTLNSDGNVVAWHYLLNGRYDWGTNFENDKISYCTYAIAMDVFNGGEKTRKYNTLTVSSDTFTVLDADEKIVAKVENGEVISDDPDIITIEPIGVTADNQITKSENTTLQLPVGKYTVVNDEGAKFTATMVNLDRANTVSTSADTVTFTVDDYCNLNEAVVYAGAGETYDIVLESTDSYENGEVSVSGVSNGNMVTTAQENGTITLNNCAGADVSVNGVSLDEIDPESKDISDAVISLDNSVYTYDGKAKLPAVTVTLSGKTLEKDKDYIVMYSDNTNCGTAKVTVLGINNYTGTNETSFKIKKRDIGNSLIVLSELSHEYDGTAHTPDAIVKDGNKTLTKDVDYTLMISDNVEVGTASVVVTGIGNYIGVVRSSFVILERGKAGDINLDGEISIGDVTEIQRYIAGCVEFDEKQMIAADIDGDGEITINDATRLQKYLAQYDVKIV